MSHHRPISIVMRPAPARPPAAALGFPPLDALLADDSVTEIMVNGPEQVWIERDGRLHETDVHLADTAHLRWIIDRIAGALGRRCDEAAPVLEARLPDGSRVHAVLPPLSVHGPSLTIRKFPHRPLTAHDLVLGGTAPAEVMELLRACVHGRQNVVVCGGAGAGKTTLLNVLSSFIPEGERILTIETAAELQLQQRHVVVLEARPADPDGRGGVTIRDLVVTALRMRPDRIVVGECRAGEALDMLQAMNTGHDGSLTTLHASGPRDAVRRLETMALMAGIDLPVRALRAQIAAAVDLIVHCERLEDGSRRITAVSEVVGMEGEIVTMADLFVFRRQGLREGRVLGHLAPTGVRPQCLDRLRQRGIAPPDSAPWPAG